jgi:Flp pilus assembly protein TadD
MGQDTTSRRRQSRTSDAVRALPLVAFLVVAAGAFWWGRAEPILDDRDQFATVARFTSPADMMGPDCYGFFRPVKNAVFAAVHFGPAGSMAAGHLVSLVIYAAVAWMSVPFFRRLLGHGAWGAVAAAVWIAAPTQVSTVAWLSCQNILLMTATLFLLTTVWDRYRCSGRGCRCLAAAGMFLLQLFALLCYEAAIVFPCLLIVRDHWIRTKIPGASGCVAKDALIGFSLLAAACGTYLFLRISLAGSEVLENVFVRNTEPAQLAFASGAIGIDHILLWLAPFGRQQILRSFVFDPIRGWLLYGAAWAAVALIVVLAVRLRRRVPEFTFGVAWFAIAYFPTGTFVPLFNGPSADYYLVIPGIGLAAAFAGVLRWVWEQGAACAGRGMQVLLIVLVIWRLAAAGEMVKWSTAWRSDHALLEAVTGNFPSEIAPRVTLARIHLRNGNPDSAYALTRDLVQGSGYAKAYYVHADAAQRLGQVDEAIRTHREVIETLNPAHPYPYAALGHLLETHRNDQAGAVSAYRQALNFRRHPDAVDAALNLGAILAVGGKETEAAALWSEFVEINPRNISLHVNLMTVLKGGDPERSEYHRQEAMKLGWNP